MTEYARFLARRDERRLLAGRSERRRKRHASESDGAVIYVFKHKHIWTETAEVVHGSAVMVCLACTDRAYRALADGADQ